LDFTGRKEAIEYLANKPGTTRGGLHKPPRAPLKNLTGETMYNKKIISILINTKVSIVSAVLLCLLNTGFIFGNGMNGWFNALCSFMEFDRELILEGEFWRVLTCHLVHWSPEHFFLDGLVFIALGIVFEKKIGPRYWKILMVSAFAVSMALLCFQNNLHAYRGISGLINTQFILGVGLFVFDRNNEKFMKVLYIIIFAIHVFKVVYETINGVSFFNTETLGDMGLFTPLAHLAGAMMGLFYLLIFIFPKIPEVLMDQVRADLYRGTRSVSYHISDAESGSVDHN
jgi:rhomboid family GlyGly-CTERM serine protease